MSTSNNMGRTTQAQPKPGVNVCIVKKEITNYHNLYANVFQHKFER